MTVTPQVIGLPFFLGMSKSPADRLPSERNRSDGSLVEGIPVDFKALPGASLQATAVCSSRVHSTTRTLKGTHKLTPNRKPTVILIVLLSRQRLQEEMDKACNQLPL